MCRSNEEKREEGRAGGCCLCLRVMVCVWSRANSDADQGVLIGCARNSKLCKVEL